MKDDVVGVSCVVEASGNDVVRNGINYEIMFPKNFFHIFTP